MKKFFKFMTLATLSTLVLGILASCEKDEPKVPSPDATITLKMVSGAKDQIVFNIATENAVDAAYLVREGADTTAPEADAIYTEGVVVAPDAADYSAKDLKAGKDYTVFAVAKNADGKFTQVVSAQAYTNACTFDLKVGEPTHFSVGVNLYPSDKKISYFFLSFPTAALKEANAMEDDAALHDFVMEGLKANYPGVPVEQFLPSVLRSGDVENGVFQPIQPETENCIVVYAMDNKGNRLSTVTRVEYKTKAVPQGELGFDIQIKDITFKKAHVIITPSDLEANYCTMGFPKNAYPDCHTAKEYAEAIVKQWGPMMNMLGMMQYKGVLDIPNFEVVPNTEYVNVAFAYNKGIASEPVMKEFKSLPPGDAEKTTYDVKVLNTFSTRADMSIKPSQEDTYYMAMVVEGANLDDNAVAKTKKDAEAYIQDYLKGQQETNPNFTLGESIMSIAQIGSKDWMMVQNLEPGKTYSLVLFGINPDGKATAYHEVKQALIKTTVYTPSNAKFTTEFFKAFKGEEAAKAGITMGLKPEELTGKYIVTVKNIINKDVDSAYYAIYPAEAMTESDDILLYNIQWNRFKKSDDLNATGKVTDYGFYLFGWADGVHTIYTVAKDANGKYGPIFKNSFSVNDSKCSPIDELKPLVKEPQKTQALKAAAPLVIKQTYRSYRVVEGK